MFRFVDVLASLRRSSDIVQHLREYFHGMDGFVPMLQTGLRAAGIFPWLTAFILRRNVSGMARQFIAGERRRRRDEDAAQKRRQKIGFTVDLLGEAVVSEKEADEYAARAMELLETLSRETRGWTDPLGKNAELFPVVNLSLKISAFYSQMDPAEPEEAIAHLAPKLRPILRRAKEAGRLRQFRHGKLRAEKQHARPFQAALHRAGVRRLAARRHRHPGLSARCRARPARSDRLGPAARHAFHRPPRERRLLGLRENQSAQNGWLCPVFLQKPESDANFEALHAHPARERIDRHRRLRFAQRAQHRARAGSTRTRLGIDKSRFEFQLLYGMAGPIKRALVEMGYRVREYCPVGELLPGMSYLVRRLLENTSNEGFLRAKFSDNLSAAQLLRDPNELIRARTARCIRAMRAEQPCSFRNGAIAKLRPATPTKTRRWLTSSTADIRNRCEPRCAKRAASLGKKYPLVIDGEKVTTGKSIASINPSAPNEIVGEVAEAGIPEAERAVKAAARSLRALVPHLGRTSRAIARARRGRSWIGAVSNFPRWKFSKSAKPGPKPMATSARRSISCLFYAQQMRLLGRPTTDPARARRRKLSALLAARRRARHRAVEFSDGDSCAAWFRPRSSPATPSS